MNDQEAFTIMVNHLRQQKARSVHPSSERECAFRGRDGMKCAVGALIPDDAYDLDMEGRSLISLLEWEGMAFLRSVNPNLLCYMMSLHDHRSIDSWEYHFSMVAKKFSLTVP